jgi:hypothetical protein
MGYIFDKISHKLFFGLQPVVEFLFLILKFGKVGPFFNQKNPWYVSKSYFSGKTYANIHPKRNTHVIISGTQKDLVQ